MADGGGSIDRAEGLVRMTGGLRQVNTIQWSVWLRAARQGSWAAASQATVSASNFLTAVILVHALGFADFGRFSICFLLTMVARNFLIGLVLTPMSTIAPRLDHAAAAYRGFTFLQMSIYALISTLILVVISWPLGILIGAPWLPVLAAPLALANLAAVGADYFRRLYFVNDRAAVAFSLDLIRYGVQFGFLLMLILWSPSSFGVEGALLALAIGAAVAMLYGLLRHGPISWSGRLARAVWPRHWQFVKWMTPGFIFDTIQVQAPFFVANAVLGEAAVGMIRAMQQLANILNLPLNAAPHFVPSLAAGVFRKGNLRGLDQFLLAVSIPCLTFVAGASAIALIFSGFFVGTLFKADQASAIPVLVSFLVLNALILVRLVLMIRAQVLERPKLIMFTSLAGSFVTLAACFGAVPLWGLAGVPAALIVGVLANICVYTLAFGRGNQPQLRPPAGILSRQSAR